MEAVEKVKVAAKGKGEVDVKFVEMDLADFESVKAGAKKVLNEAERLDVVMLNAGIVCPR